MMNGRKVSRMKLVVDVHYNNDDYAVASGILFFKWEPSSFEKKISVRIDEIKPYKPGSFFERELPCILALLSEIDNALEVIVVDGFVTLGAEKRDGLGAHLYRALDGKTPVIGVAKNSFAGTSDDCKVFRGDSKKPLYVTSVGIAHSDAKRYIQSMHGEFRVPTLLKLVDSECRSELK